MILTNRDEQETGPSGGVSASSNEDVHVDTVNSYTHHPLGYRNSQTVPVFRGINHCAYCLCVPCIVMLPPDFLRRSAGPHPANDEKLILHVLEIIE